MGRLKESIPYIKKDSWVACVWQNDTKKLETVETQQIGKITLLLLQIYVSWEKNRWSLEHFLVFAGTELVDAYSPLFGLFLYNYL